MKKFDVPFVDNPDNHCVPATIGMVLGYFLPEKKFSLTELDNMCGYVEGRGTWQALPMLTLHDMGLEVYWIEDFDYTAFVNEPRAYLASILSPEALEYQLKNTDLDLEARRMKAYIGAGLPLQKRKGTKEDVIKFIDDGWLVCLQVNDRPLSSLPGYNGHSILVVGYDDEGVIIHNPDGINGNKPNQYVSWELLEKTWREFGGSFSLLAFRKR